MKEELFSNNLLTKWLRKLLVRGVCVCVSILLFVKMFMSCIGCPEEHITPFNPHRNWEMEAQGWVE